MSTLGYALKNLFNKAIKKAEKDLSIHHKNVVFSALPETYDDFIALPQAKLADAYDAAAMTVVAFNTYPKDKDLAIRMLNYLRGPRQLSNLDLQFYADRFHETDYVPRSYFKGAVPKNDYTPSEPYTVSPFTNPHSDLQENMKRIWLTSGGADSPRYVDVRLAKDGKWYLWEQHMLVEIRKPDSEEPWA